MSVPGFVIVSDDETGDVQTAVIDNTGNQKVVSLEEAGNYRQITHVSTVRSIPSTPRYMMTDGKTRKPSYYVRYKCDFCNQMFEGVKSLREHRKDSHAGPSGEPEKKIVFNCIRSSKEKRSEEMEALVVRDKTIANRVAAELQCLEAKVVPKRPRYTARNKHRCTLCEKSFATPSMLDRHQSVHTGKKSHWCQLCGKAYSQPEHLQRHLRSVHSETVQGPLSVRQKPIWHVCSVCGQKFTAKYRYIEHLKVHINGLFQCPICERRFTIKNSLMRHIKSHTGERNFVCDICNKRFGDQQTMKNHRRLHLGDYRYRCNVCDKGYSKKARLVEHMDKHSEESGAILEFGCNICQERTDSLEALEHHKQLHTVKPVENWKGATQKSASSQAPPAADESDALSLLHCSTCLQSFEEQKQLTKHCQTYHKYVISDSKGFSRFSCDVCRKSFLTREEIQFHMALHESGNRDQPEPLQVCSPEVDSSVVYEVTQSGAVISRTAESSTSTTTLSTMTTMAASVGASQLPVLHQEPTPVGQVIMNQNHSSKFATPSVNNSAQANIGQQLTVPASQAPQTVVPNTSIRAGLMLPPKKKAHVLSAQAAQNVVYKRSLLTGLLEPTVKETVTPVAQAEQTVYAIEENGQLYGVSDNGTMYQVISTENVETVAAGWPPTEQQMESGDLLLDIVPQHGSTLSFLSIPQTDAANVQYVITESHHSNQTTEDVTCKLIQAAQHVEEMENNKSRGKV